MTASSARATSTGQKKPPSARETTTKKPKLKVLDRAALRRRARRRALFTLSSLAVAVTLFAVALAYAQLVTGQQQIDDLREEIATAEAQRAALERNVAVASTPDAIVARAVELGMVRAVDPQYLEAIRTTNEAADAG